MFSKDDEKESTIISSVTKQKKSSKITRSGKEKNGPGEECEAFGQDSLALKQRECSVRDDGKCP
jgi:hypothetical protein